MENIPAFVFAGALYIMTGPSVVVALWHFRVFTIARFLHTIAYQCALPSPARPLTFAVGVFTTLSMLVQTSIAVL